MNVFSEIVNWITNTNMEWIDRVTGNAGNVGLLYWISFPFKTDFGYFAKGYFESDIKLLFDNPAVKVLLGWFLIYFSYKLLVYFCDDRKLEKIMKLRAWNPDKTAPIDYIVPTNSIHLWGDKDDVARAKRQYEADRDAHNTQVMREILWLKLVARKYNVPNRLFQWIGENYIKRPIVYGERWGLGGEGERRYWIPFYVICIFLVSNGIIIYLLLMMPVPVATMNALQNCTVIQCPAGPPGNPGVKN